MRRMLFAAPLTKALKRPLLVVLPDKDGKFLHDGGVKTPPGSDKG